MEIQGKIIEALPVRTGTSARGEWKVQEFVLETFDDRFTRKMVFSVFGEDRLRKFNIQVGQQVNVSFDIDAREYQGRWFNSIRAFDVRPVLADVQQPVSPAPAAPGSAPFDQSAPPFAQPVAPAPQQAAPAPPPVDPFGADAGSDELPF
ncbi:MAG: DUF3127 domain-containing protein [Prevotella sp.]|nr:DUF3127 domain-containing protein [Prevotella sp.]